MSVRNDTNAAARRRATVRRYGIPAGFGLLAFLSIVFWPQPSTYGWIFYLWVVATAGCLATIPSDRRPIEGPSPETLSVLAALMVLAIGFRLPGLADTPANIAADEILPGLEAMHIADGEFNNVFSSLGWFTIPGVSFAIPAVFMKLIPGTPFFALRFSSMMTGLAGISFLFLLARRLFNDRVALAAVALAAVNFWHVHNSRTGFPFIQTSTFVSMALYLLVRARQDRDLRMMAIAGAGIGFALQAYFPVRALLMLVPMFLFFGWVGRRDRFTTILKESAMLLLGIALLLGPMLRSQEPVHFLGRSQSVLITRPAVQQEFERIYRVQGFGAVLRRNIEEATSMLTEWADVCILNRSPSGLFDRITLTAIGVGVLIAVGQAHPAGLLLVGWIAAVFFFGVAMTDGPRASYRFGPAMPALLMLAGFAFERTLLERMPDSRWYRMTILPAVFVALITWIGLTNYQLFFYDYAIKGDGRMVPLASAWRFLGENCDGRNFYFLASPEPMGSEQMLDVFCPQHAPITVEQVPQQVDESRAATFIVMGWQRSSIERLKQCYPGGVVEEHRAPDRRYLFSTMVVPSGEVREGLKNCAPKPMELKIPTKPS